MSAIEADRLSVRLASREVLHEVDVGVDRGEVLGLIGPNGAGKSTLLRALAGLVKPAGGGVRVGDDDLRRIPVRALARRIAYVPQDHVPSAELTVRDLVRMGRYAHRQRLGPLAAPSRRSDDAAAVEAALDQVGLAPLSDRVVTALSGGERQLTQLARALAQDAPVLLADEPTAALDLGHQLEVFGIVRRFAAHGGACVLVLHDLDHAARFCDRLALVGDGRIAAAGRPETVLTPQRIADVYGVEVAVGHDPAVGSLRITPLALVGDAKLRAASGRTDRIPALDRTPTGEPITDPTTDPTREGITENRR